MTIRVVFGEDSYLPREAILRVLEHEQDINVVATCGDYDSLRLTVEDVHPDVVLADISMPPPHTDEGIQLAAELRTTQPDVGVVILSQYAEPAFATKLLVERGDLACRDGRVRRHSARQRVIASPTARRPTR